jgi:hypothetical protein
MRLLKRKECIEPNCTSPVWARRRCKHHDSLINPKKYEVNKVSDKMKDILAEFFKKKKVFIKNNPYCKLELDGCTGIATDVEHRKGKATRELYLDEKYWWPSCRNCNRVVETLGEKAYEKHKFKHNSKDKKE